MPAGPDRQGRMKKKLAVCAAVLLVITALLSGCGKYKKGDLPDSYIGTFRFYEYDYTGGSNEFVPTASLYEPTKDSAGNDILEFTVKADGTLVANGKEYAGSYVVATDEEAAAAGFGFYESKKAGLSLNVYTEEEFRDVTENAGFETAFLDGVAAAAAGGSSIASLYDDDFVGGFYIRN